MAVAIVAARLRRQAGRRRGGSDNDESSGNSNRTVPSKCKGIDGRDEGGEVVTYNLFMFVIFLHL